MFDKYYYLVVIALEKLPFFNYINRFVSYVWNPDLKDNESIKDQLEHSLLDVFNALGLVIVVSGAFALYSTDFEYMNTYKVFNPIFLALSYITYGVIFSLFMSIVCWFLSKLLFFNFDGCAKTLRYTVFCHSLRFYAATAFLLGLLAVHAMGVVVTEGVTFNNSFDHWFLYIYIFIVLIWFPFRLYFSPLFKYLTPNKYKVIGYALILLASYIATSVNQFLPLTFSEKILNNIEFYKLVKSTTRYKEAQLCQKAIKEKLYCETKDKQRVK
jgi:hypothetical protein